MKIPWQRHFRVGDQVILVQLKGDHGWHCPKDLLGALGEVVKTVETDEEYAAHERSAGYRVLRVRFPSESRILTEDMLKIAVLTPFEKQVRDYILSELPQ